MSRWIVAQAIFVRTACCFGALSKVFMSVLVLQGQPWCNQVGTVRAVAEGHFGSSHFSQTTCRQHTVEGCLASSFAPRSAVQFSPEQFIVVVSRVVCSFRQLAALETSAGSTQVAPKSVQIGGRAQTRWRQLHDHGWSFSRMQSLFLERQSQPKRRASRAR